MEGAKEMTRETRNFSIELTQQLSNSFCEILRKSSPMFGEALLALLASTDAVLRVSQENSGGNDDFERDVRDVLGNISRQVLQNAGVSREEVLALLRDEEQVN